MPSLLFANKRRARSWLGLNRYKRFSTGLITNSIVGALCVCQVLYAIRAVILFNLFDVYIVFIVFCVFFALFVLCVFAVFNVFNVFCVLPVLYALFDKLSFFIYLSN